jgi:hypothetical protein
MPRLHNVSSVRRRGPRGGLGSGGGTSGGRRRPGGEVGTTPGLLGTDAIVASTSGIGTCAATRITATTSSTSATAGGIGKLVVSTGGSQTSRSGDTAAQSIGGKVSDATGPASLDDDWMAADLSLGGVRKSLDATFRHSQSPPIANTNDVSLLPPNTQGDDAAAAAAAVESFVDPPNGEVDVKANAIANPAPADDDLEFHASQCDDTMTNDGESSSGRNGAIPPVQTPAVQEEEAEAAANNTNTARPSSRRRRRKVRKGGATACADADANADAGTTPVSRADESAEKGRSEDDDKMMSDALAAVMAQDDVGTNDDGQEDGNGPSKKGSDGDVANANDDNKITAASTEPKEQRQKQPPAKKKKSSRPNKLKRRIVGSRVIECEKAPPLSIPPGTAAHSPHPQETAAKKRRTRSVASGESTAASGLEIDENVATKDITATPADKVKRAQPAVPDSGISVNSLASTPCAAGRPGNESAPDTPADVAHIQGLFDQLNEQVRRKQEEYEAEKKSIHQKWQRKYAKTKERYEAKVRQYQVGYDNLSKEFDDRFAQVNRERAEEKTGFEKKDKMLSERIEKIATELEQKNDKLERWRGRMQEAKQMHAEAWEINDRCVQLKEALDAREGRLKNLEEDYELRNTSLRKQNEQLQKKERELAQRELDMEAAIRRKINAEISEKQSLRSFGHSVAQKLIGFGGSGSDTDGGSGDSLHQQRLLLDKRELSLDDRERDLDAREKALQENNTRNGLLPPSKKTPAKKQYATSRYAFGDSLTLLRSPSGSFDTTPPVHSGRAKQKKVPQTPTRFSPRKKVKVIQSAPPVVQGGGGKKRPAQKTSRTKKKLVVMDASDSDSSEDF